MNGPASGIRYNSCQSGGRHDGHHGTQGGGDGGPPDDLNGAG